MASEELGMPVDILLVEDNPGDIELTKMAFSNARIRNNLYVVENGDQAMDFLSQKGDYCNVPRPDIILLDLHLPGKDGWEVLADIKEDDDLKDIPVIILTTSKAEEDVIRTYKLHANSYIQKPVDVNEFIATIRSLEDFWLTVVKLPHRK
jgi:two-component system, chemotaxis family, response regulator Rcp1